MPDNYAQVLKKLESTEQCLMKQPEHALSYDMQVKDMEEMKFSRKLTEKEKSEWKGPVHYVARHAVLPRSYETEREPDIYVKTVLTFGDRLAPTMIITAMRKTDNR